MIAILLLLAALLLPALRSAKDSSKTVACSNNLRQLGLAAHLYADDYRDYFPWALSNAGGYYGSWCAPIRHYLGGVKGNLAAQPLNDLTAAPTPLSYEFRNCAETHNQSYDRRGSIYNNPFLCPATFGINSTTSGGGNPFGSIYGANIVDYAMSFRVAGWEALQALYPARPRGYLPRPELTALIADGQRVLNFGSGAYCWLAPRHAKLARINVLLADGHVEAARCSADSLAGYSSRDQDIIWDYIRAGSSTDIFNGGPYRGYKVYVLP